MQYIDTHCHIHSEDYPLDADVVMVRAVKAGVTKLVCVGTDEDDSKLAVEFVKKHVNCWASVGIHPHDASRGIESVAALVPLVTHSKVVAIGECGLDYYYNNSPKDEQIEVLYAHIKLALQYDLPLIFHVRDAFDDFWPIFDHFDSNRHKIRGVLHSFTDSAENLEKALKRRLFIGVNGISTFTKDQKQLEMFTSIPVNRIILETDAPFLTPEPFRGRVNEPAFVSHVAEKQADLHTINLQELSAATSANATRLFHLN